MSTKVTKAYLKWVSTANTCICCATGHYYKVEIKNRKVGKDNPRYEFVPKPDNEVCERERAWREYVRLRGDVVPVRKEDKTQLTEADIQWLNSIGSYGKFITPKAQGKT